MSEKPSILIIDDDENLLETLSDILQEKGYQIETAKTGEEAITKSKEHFFHIALIDIKLPDMTGTEILRTFRKEYPFRMNIIITGYATIQNTVEALNLGANAYIMKPIDHKKLDRITKKVPTNIQTSIMPLTFSKNGKPMLKAKDSIQKLGIRYMHIKRI